METQWETSMWSCVPGANCGKESFMFHLHGQETEPRMSRAACSPLRFSNIVCECTSDCRLAGEPTPPPSHVQLQRGASSGGVAWRKGMLPGPRNLRKKPNSGQDNTASRIVHGSLPAKPERLTLCQSWPDLCSCKANSQGFRAVRP